MEKTSVTIQTFENPNTIQRMEAEETPPASIPTGEFATYWQLVAEERPEIAGIALGNQRQVEALRELLYSGKATYGQIIELGHSYGAANSMEGAAPELYKLFVRLYAENNQYIHPQIFSKEDAQQAAYELLVKYQINDQPINRKLLYAAQFLEEASQLDNASGVDKELQTLMAYGAVDLYEQIWTNSEMSWHESDKRQALLYWHGALTRIIAADMAKFTPVDQRYQELDEMFREVQIITIEQIHEFSKLRSPHPKRPHEWVYGVKNGELNEFYAQIAGWFLIRHDRLFGGLEIKPAYARQDRPSDQITGRRTAKYGYDAEIIQRSASSTNRTLVQLKACPRKQHWESKYAEEIKIVRIRNISEDRLRQKYARYMKRVRSEYRSHKPRQIHTLRSDVEGFFRAELLTEAA